MTRAIVRQLITQHVAAVSGLPPLQLENTPNIGITGSEFSRLTLLPATTVQSTVGLNGKDRHTGLAQIDLFFPVNLGTAEADAIADVVCAAFPRGFTLSQGGVHVHFGPPSISVGYIFEPFYCLPVTVRWDSLLPA